MRIISDEAMACMVIWQEARGESFEGKVAVGEVLRNRMKRKVHSDGTMAGTVFKAYQFSGMNSKDPNRIPAFKLDTADPVCQACMKAWEMSSSTSLVKGATMYYNPKATKQLGYPEPAWATPDKHLVTLGSHEFYKD